MQPCAKATGPTFTRMDCHYCDEAIDGNVYLGVFCSKQCYRVHMTERVVDCPECGEEREWEEETERLVCPSDCPA